MTKKEVDTMQERIARIIKNWNIEVCEAVQIYDTAWQIGDQYYYILSEKLNGSHIASLQQIPDIGVEMGGIIAKLHMAFKECENQEEFWNNSVLAEMQGWIRNIFCENDVYIYSSNLSFS